MEADNSNRRRRHRNPLDKMSYSNKGRFFKLRNILNTLFIIIVIVGMAVYFYSSHSVGAVILIIGVVIKLTESVLRIIH